MDTTEETTPKRRGRPPKPKAPPPPFVSGIPEGDVIEVHLDEIDFENTELEFRVDQKLKDLVEDIKVNGQQFPVILRKPKGAKQYQIISGFRRCRSIQSLEWPTVKAIVRSDLDDDMAFRISFMENERRKNYTGVDKAHAIAKLRLRDKTDAEIQDIFGLGKTQIDRYKQVSTFPPVIKDAISDGKIKTTHSLALMRAFNAHGDKVDLADWIDRVDAEELSVRKLTRLLNSQFGKPKKKKRYFEKQKDGGFRLYPMRFDPKTTTAADKRAMITRLGSALALLKGE